MGLLSIPNRPFPTCIFLYNYLRLPCFFSNIMSSPCTSCQHLKRPEIDRRLAAGEPVAQIARDYDLNLSSLHRHRTNCLKLASSNQIKKDAARGSAAIELLPSKETLSDAYLELRTRIDQVVEQAQQ